MKPIVVIVGMARSGTSLCAQALERLGVSFGAPLIEADKANPRGYYEHKNIHDAQTRYMLECCDQSNWTGIGELEIIPEREKQGEEYITAMWKVVSAGVDEYELFGVKTAFWPRIPEVWWDVVDGCSPIFIHTMRGPLAVLNSTVVANNTRCKLTRDREQAFYKQWAWNNAQLFELEPTAEIWFENWWTDADGSMKKLADVIGREPVSTEGLLI